MINCIIENASCCDLLLHKRQQYPNVLRQRMAWTDKKYPYNYAFSDKNHTTCYFVFITIRCLFTKYTQRTFQR